MCMPPSQGPCHYLKCFMHIISFNPHGCPVSEEHFLHFADKKSECWRNEAK